MSGHSKWSTIKRKKAATDAARGKVFTRLTREIIAAARAGGEDPAVNGRLRTAIQAAKSENMPNANIDRAVKRGTGDLEGAQIEEAALEGYGPGGVALYIEVLTDNRNRTVADVRHLLTRHGGSMGEAGSVAWMFTPKGSLTIGTGGRAEEQLMELVADAGAEDFAVDGDTASIVTGPAEMFSVREALEGHGVTVESAQLIRVPQSTVHLEGRDAEQLLKLLDALEELDDVQGVSANFDIPDDILHSHGN